MRKLQTLFFLLVTFVFDVSSQDALRINEVMISNIDGYMSDYDFPDSWVELYNPTNMDISLINFCLENLTEDRTESYIFPASVKVQAGSYLVICCDKQSKTYHTSYKLDADGGTLTLKSGDGKVVDEVTYPKMIAPGVGYGRTTTNINKWQWERTATPESANDGVFTDLLLPCPVFSTHGHIMSSSEIVTITMPSDDYPKDTKIYVTFDGKEPTKESEASTSFTFNLDTTTIIRAKLMSDSALSRPSITQSYIFHPRSTTFPIISIVTDYTYLFDKQLGIFSSDTVFNNNPNYSYNWRRPINMEYLGKLNEPALFNQLGETALSGGSSRRAPQKSLKLFADKRFGTKHINGSLWTDKPNIKKNKSILLRSGGNVTATYRITDAFAQTLFGRHIKNLDWQAYSPAITYINGKYYGVCGLRERSDENYVWANFNEEEDIERIESLTTVSNNDFNDFMSVITADGSTYQDIEPYIDAEEWCNYLCLQIFSVNTDWPYNNISLWRKNQNGKWRWITKDIDLLGYIFRAKKQCDPYKFNMLRYLTLDCDSTSREFEVSHFATWPPKHFVIFKKLLSLDEFSSLLIDKLSVYLGDFLKPGVTHQLLMEMRDEIDTELASTWKIHYDRNNTAYFQGYMLNTLSFLSLRPRNVYEHLADYYNLGSVIPMVLKSNGSEIKVNDTELTEGDFNGCCFSNRVLRLDSGKRNLGWKMTTYAFANDTVSTDYIFKTTELRLMLKDYGRCDSVSFETYAFDIDEFDMKLHELAIEKTQCKDWTEVDDIMMEEPQYAYANLTNLETLPISKDDEVKAFMDFYDNNGNYFHKPVLLSLQGSSEPKINLLLQFVDKNWDDNNPPSFTFGYWVEQDAFYLKAFQEDALRGTTEIAYKLYDMMRGITDGPHMTGDAFPMSLYVNGNFYGMMSWQLKKHRKNMGLAKDEATNVWIDGKLNEKQIFGGEINWNKFEVRNPKDLYNMDGTDYDGDNPQEIIDSNSAAYTGKKKMVRCAEAKQHIIEMSKYSKELETQEVNDATTEDMRNAISKRFDAESLIDYIVFSLVTNNYKGFSENWQWYTCDGKKWAVVPYNCELTFGFNNDNNDLWPAIQSSEKYDYKMENTLLNSPLSWIKTYFWDDIKARYAELRDIDIFNADNITSMAQAWSNRIGNTNYTEEYVKWGIGTNNIVSSQDMVNHIQSWIIERLKLLDDYLEYTPGTDVNCDGRVDIADVNAVLDVMFSCTECPSKADVNEDGIVDIADVNAVLTAIFTRK